MDIPYYNSYEYDYDKIVISLQNSGKDFNTLSEVYFHVLDYTNTYPHAIQFFNDSDIHEQELLNNWDLDYLPDQFFWNNKFYDTHLNVPKHIKKVGFGCFGYSDIQEVNFKRVEELEGGMFIGCYELNTVTLPESLIEVAPSSFNFNYPNVHTTIKIPRKAVDNLIPTHNRAGMTKGREEDLLRNKFSPDGAYWEIIE